MASLTSQSIASSYEQLLHLDRDGGGNGTTHVALKDGDNGTTFPITLATDAIMITSTNRLEFGDNASYIHQSADGVLDLVSDTEIELTATNIDINGIVDISGNATFNGTVLIDGVSNYTGLEVKGSGSARPSIKWSNVNNGAIGSIYGTEGNALIFSSGTGGATSLTLDSSQVATFAGEIIAPSGVNFPDDASSNPSSDVNTLDSYEEGTWTPVFKSGSDILTFPNFTAVYTKIGNMVHLTYGLSNQTTSGTVSSTATFSVEGIPFAAKKNSNGSDINHAGSIVGFGGGITFDGDGLVHIQLNSSVIKIYQTHILLFKSHTQ